MMIKTYGSVSASAMFVLGAAACILSVAPAQAQKLVNTGLPPMDPVLAYAEQLAPQNTFFLNSSDDVEVVRF